MQIVQIHIDLHHKTIAQGHGTGTISYPTNPEAKVPPPLQLAMAYWRYETRGWDQWTARLLGVARDGKGCAQLLLHSSFAHAK